MADLTQLLLACSDPALVQQAQQQLAAMEQANYPTFLGSLIAEMGSENKPQEARQRAGLLLKNTLVAKSEETRREQAQRWVAVDPTVRGSIKQMLLHLLASPHKEIRSTAALAIASIATIDIPRNEWPEPHLHPRAQHRQRQCRPPSSPASRRSATYVRSAESICSSTAT